MDSIHTFIRSFEIDLKLCLEIAYVMSNSVILFIFDPEASNFSKRRTSTEGNVYAPAGKSLEAIKPGFH